MNQDNRRLQEIQREKQLYTNLLVKADTISDCIEYQSRLDNLNDEEKQILERYDVIL